MAFTPTLRLLKVTEADLARSPYNSVDEVAQSFSDFFDKLNIRESIDFTSERIEIIETGEIITDYVGLVVGKFRRNGVLHLQLASGDVVGLEIVAA